MDNLVKVWRFMKNKKRPAIRTTLLILLSLIGIGFLIPQHFRMPVVGAGERDYNPKTFWYYPWGKSGTHKGVDIFAKKGTPLIPSVSGLVVSAKEDAVGGKYVLILGPKWRFHYYAHLDQIHTSKFSWVNSKDTIGTVGASGNAAGKPPHLHYSIVTIFPYFWKIDKEPQGWKKMFFLNPLTYLKKKKTL